MQIMASYPLLHERKTKAEELLSRVKLLHEIKGHAKLLRKIVAEKDFLSNLEKKSCGNEFLENHLKSSNLNHLEAIVITAEKAKNVYSILKKVSFSQNENFSTEIVVDVEADNGKHWFKVFARNPGALHRVWEGLGQFGDKDVCSLAANYQKAAKQNLVDFKEPSVVFLFACGVTQSVAKDLRDQGVKVIGQIISDPCEIM